MRDAMTNHRLGRGTNEYTNTATTITVSRKLVPQRTCAVENCCAASGVSSTSFSYAAIALCSAPWYWNTRRISLSCPTTTRYAMNSASRTMPSVIGNDPWNQCENPLPANAGITMNTALKKITAGSTAQPSAFSEMRSSSATCWLADQ